MLVRFVAVTVIGLGLVMAGLSAADSLARKVPVDKIHCALLLIPVLLGIVMLIRSKALAEWLSDRLEL